MYKIRESNSEKDTNSKKIFLVHGYLKMKSINIYITSDICELIHTSILMMDYGYLEFLFDKKVMDNFLFVTSDNNNDKFKPNKHKSIAIINCSYKWDDGIKYLNLQTVLISNSTTSLLKCNTLNIKNSFIMDNNAKFMCDDLHIAGDVLIKDNSLLICRTLINIKATGRIFIRNNCKCVSNTVITKMVEISDNVY